MYVLAHFSDFHLRAIDEEFDRALALIDDALDQGVDHIVITGDIVDVAQIDVVAAFMKALRARSWGTPDKLTITPGNHDIFPVAWSALRSPLALFKRPTSRFEALCRKLRSCNSGRLFSNAMFPLGKCLSRDVLLAGMDTTRNEMYMPWQWSQGELPEEDIDQVQEFFASRSVAHRIVAMHHFPYDVEIDAPSPTPKDCTNFHEPDAETVRSWLRWTGATLVLCGHHHWSGERSMGRNCRLVCTGSSGGLDNEYEDGDSDRTYHIIELHRSGRVRIVPRVFCGEELDG